MVTNASICTGANMWLIWVSLTQGYPNAKITNAVNAAGASRWTDSSKWQVVIRC